MKIYGHWTEPNKEVLTVLRGCSLSYPASHNNVCIGQAYQTNDDDDDDADYDDAPVLTTIEEHMILPGMIPNFIFLLF